jgi:hypothetical protein
VYGRHPHYRSIANQNTFDEKIAAVLEALNHRLKLSAAVSGKRENVHCRHVAFASVPASLLSLRARLDSLGSEGGGGEGNAAKVKSEGGGGAGEGKRQAAVDDPPFHCELWKATTRYLPALAQKGKDGARGGRGMGGRLESCSPFIRARVKQVWPPPQVAIEEPSPAVSDA